MHAGCPRQTFSGRSKNNKSPEVISSSFWTVVVQSFTASTATQFLYSYFNKNKTFTMTVFRIVVLVLIISCLSSTILGAEDHDHTHHEHGHFHHHYNPHNRWGSSSSSAAQPRLKTPRQALEPVFQWKQMDFEDIPGKI